MSSLTRGLVSLGHECHVLAILDVGEMRGNPFLEEIDQAGVRVTTLQLGNRAYLRERRTLVDLLRRLQPDVLHTHGYRADVQGVAAARRARVPIISTAHGFCGGGWKNRLFEHLQERTLAQADRVVAVSRPIVERLQKRGVAPERLRWIANAWEPSGPALAREEARHLLGLAPSARVIGWVGRLSHEKGGDTFVRAVAGLRSAGVVACLIGDGPERVPLERLAKKLGISDQIRFVGVVARASRVIPAFDAFCLSSRTEGTPIALLEAMSARVPVVATRVGGVPDVVGPAEGWLVEAVDPAAMADVLDEALMSTTESARRVEAASERLRTHFAVAPWLDRYVEIYSELAKGPTR
ncbi:glycosyltransferase [Myxococcota bacterium]|nr:glycosyltransferase [Myxococcota bacterium]